MMEKEVSMLKSNHCCEKPAITETETLHNVQDFNHD
jgi:hypothetical protein